jgi:RimJ/RimL family protein N-acetyltransferase
VQRLWEHTICLTDADLRLRPLTEDDWEILRRWNSDPEVLYYCEGDEVEPRTLEQVQRLYRSISQTAFCFMMEWQGAAVGECYLQRMNLERILRAFPDQDLHRIDIMIGEKGLWRQGLGSRAIALLVGLGFHQGADAIFACEVADYNPRSRGAFEKNGFRLWNTNVEPPGSKASLTFDLMLTRKRWVERRRDAESLTAGRRSEVGLDS